MNKRKGRERRRHIKRRQIKRSKLPIFSGYDLSKLVGYIIEVKLDKELYIGRLRSFKVGLWNPNIRYAKIELSVPGGEMSFHLSNNRKVKLGSNCWSLGIWYHNEDIDGKARINRILPKVDALIFQMEHNV